MEKPAAHSASPDHAPAEPPARLATALRFFALQSALWLALALVFAAQLYALRVFPWDAALAISLIDWAPWIVLGPAVLWLARRIPINPQTWRRALPAHLALGLLFVLLNGLVGQLFETQREAAFSRRDEPRSAIEAAAEPAPRPRDEHESDAFGPRPPGRHDEPDGPRFAGSPPPNRRRAPESFWARLLLNSRFSLPVYWMLVAGAQAVAQYRRGIERERRALQAEARLAEARLQALQGQLNPHFLFNTLNTITELVYDDPRAAETMIVALADLLRAALAVRSRTQVPLSEEIGFVRRYCDIQKVRFSDRLDVRYEIDSAALDAPVPTLLLQPLVENAVIHGMGSAATPIVVRVRARRDDNVLRLEVADSGGARATPPDRAGEPLHVAEGVGLSNTRARLAALHGDAARFEIVRAAEGGVAVRIDLPLSPSAT